MTGPEENNIVKDVANRLPSAIAEYRAKIKSARERMKIDLEYLKAMERLAKAITPGEDDE